jgi:hypothetical protein
MRKFIGCTCLALPFVTLAAMSVHWPCWVVQQGRKGKRWAY